MNKLSLVSILLALLAISLQYLHYSLVHIIMKSVDCNCTLISEEIFPPTNIRYYFMLMLMI